MRHYIDRTPVPQRDTTSTWMRNRPIMRRMTILLQWTYYILLHRTRMLLAELMFAMYGNANYEPDGDIILESTQIIPQTDEDCLDLVFDEPSWIAQKHRKIGII
ncbi:hypothetical protein AVEN_156779-1 [Araneus ventricosus]|uniref:Uncharacterized protein n=1 Tax=Araneus ventricosus TaxID=182803 RepID=A0A4Y2QWY8_ARAVE|nr:hypothetical protein AVEN_156779-1 [Araneus ventricosus]